MSKSFKEWLSKNKDDSIALIKLRKTYDKRIKKYRKMIEDLKSYDDLNIDHPVSNILNDNAKATIIGFFHSGILSIIKKELDNIKILRRYIDG
jgi:hypothetical protein